MNIRTITSSTSGSMKNRALPIAVFVAVTLSVSASHWPAWRGPNHNGTAPDANPPIEWSDTKNVKWKVKLPGHGSATPVVWEDKIFIQAAVKKEAAQPTPPVPAEPGDGRRRGRSEKPSDTYQFMVLCLDRKTGKTIWEKIAKETVPHEGHHQDHGFASSSPITDGKHLYAYFGSRGLYCYDLTGTLKWSKEFGQLQTRGSFGEGASPALHGDYLVVNWDHEGDDFITALDKNTGKEIWRTPRREETSWGTPLIIEFKGQKQVIVNATTKVRSYDLATGKEIWICGGQTGNAIPSAVADENTVYAMSGFRGAALQAIELGHTGDLTGTPAVKWSHNQNTPYVPSPTLINNRLYFLSQRGAALTGIDTRTGKPFIDAERLPGVFNAYASPVATKDHVYILSREGKCVVIKQSDKLEIVAENALSDRTDASIAIVGNELFIRGKEHLYCIAQN